MSGSEWTSRRACLVGFLFGLVLRVVTVCESSSLRVEVALEREVEGDLFLQDIGQGFGFRPGTFDGCIRYASVSFPSCSQYNFTPTSNTSRAPPPGCLEASVVPTAHCDKRGQLAHRLVASPSSSGS